MKKITVLSACVLIYFTGIAQDIYISKDTTLKADWNITPRSTILHFGSRGHIHGNATINGGIIDAAYQQSIFDTGVIVNPYGVYTNVFSAAWYGVSSSNNNNSPNLQAAINCVIRNSDALRNIYIPKGIYHIKSPVIMANLHKDLYRGVSIHLYGECNEWDASQGTTIVYDPYNGFALGGQVLKGTEIDHLTITGQFKAPAPRDSIYYNLPIDSFTDHKCSPTYAGIVIDYDGTKNTDGSTDVHIHDVNVGRFVIDYLISPNGITFNADALLLENIRCGDAKVGVSGGQAQEKNNVIREIYSWGRIHTVFATNLYGKNQAGNYIIEGANIAGYPIRLIYNISSGWYPTYLSDIYCESLGTFGYINAQIPVSVNNSVFHFAYWDGLLSKLTLLNTSSTMIQFNNDLFRYYNGKGDPMRMHGVATFNNCLFSGPVIDPTRGSVYNSCYAGGVKL